MIILKDGGLLNMKKIFASVLSITAIGALAINVSAQETAEELYEDLSNEAVIALDLLSQLNDLEPSDVTLEEILGETQDFETYIGLLDLGVAILDVNADTIIEENYTAMDVFIDESDDNIEMETFIISEGEMYPNVYGNQETDELTMYTDTGIEESSLAESIGDINEVFYYRYEELEDLLMQLEEYAVIYENDDYYVLTVESDEDEVEEIINSKDSFMFEGIDEDSKTFGLVALIDKELSLLTNTAMFADAYNPEETGRITVEVGVMYEGFDEYGTLEEFRENNDILYEEAPTGEEALDDSTDDLDDQDDMDEESGE